MSLRTRVSSLPASAPQRPRIPIARVPQPREDRMPATWRLAKPGVDRPRATSRPGTERRWLVRGRERPPTWGARNRSPGPSRAAKWSSGGRPTGHWWPARAPARTWARCSRCPVWTGTMYCRWHGLGPRRGGDPTWTPYRRLRRRRADLGPPAHPGRDADRRPAIPPRPPLSRVGRRRDRDPGGASPATSSPTGSTPGTAPGSTRTRSATSSSTTRPPTSTCWSST